VTFIDTFISHAVKLPLNFSWLSRFYAVLIDRSSEERAYSISLIKSSLFVHCFGTENGGSKLLRNIGNIYWSLRPDILEDLSLQQNSSKNLKSPNTVYVYVSFHKFVKVCLISKRRTTIGLCAIVSRVWLTWNVNTSNSFARSSAFQKFSCWRCFIYCWGFLEIRNLNLYAVYNYTERDGRGIESCWRREFSHSSRPSLGPNQPPIQGVLVHSRRESRWGVALTTNIHLAPRLKKE